MNLLSQNCYILDTGFFVLARDYYPGTFPSFWEKMDTAVIDGVILSVHEVREEIKEYGGEQEHLIKWANENKDIFDPPGKAEQNKLKKVMADFKNVVSEKMQQKEGPWADPFVIARAWDMGGTVVTREKSAKSNEKKKGKKKGKKKVHNLHKIPDICKVLKIRCITPQEFMKEQGWKF